MPRSARVRDLRDYLAELPDPKEYAYRLSGRHVAALKRSILRHSIRVLLPEDAELLRPLGLADYASCAVTAFGAAVYRAIVEEPDA